MPLSSRLGNGPRLGLASASPNAKLSRTPETGEANADRLEEHVRVGMGRSYKGKLTR
jgi:hypothetical protein